MVVFSIIGNVVAGGEVSGGWRSAMSENIVSEEVDLLAKNCLIILIRHVKLAIMAKESSQHYKKYLFKINPKSIL